MAKRWIFLLKKLSKRLSVRAGLFGVFGVISSPAGVFFRNYVPDEFADIVGGDAVDNILTMMASSMLVVLTFSLSTMVAAYSSATQHATPRATSLVKNDTESHSAISMFLGAFIYSVVSLIALSTEYYGEKGRVILLGTTIVVLTAVVWVIIRWVAELKNMGSVHETIKRVEEATSAALHERAVEPTFGCRQISELPKSVIPIFTSDVGFVQNIDLKFLDDLAREEKYEIYLENDVGAFVHPQSPLIYLRSFRGDSRVSDELIGRIKKAFAIGSHRTFEKDPLYGISVLSGVGIKAMSPSLNDPGTAIDVVGSLIRIFVDWDNLTKDKKNDEPKFENLYFPRLKVEELLHAGFYDLARESIGSLQATKSIKHALQLLSKSHNLEYRQASEELLRVLDLRARDKFTMSEDLDIIIPAKCREREDFARQ